MLSHETLKSTTEDKRTSLEKQHIQMQLAAYENAAGWFYWTYKTEQGGIWSFREQVEQENFLLL